VTILELREALETLLVDQLGTYRLANGIHTPAVSVRAVGEPMIAGTTVNGMELVIVRDPQLEPITQYQSPEAFRRWTVYLVDWDGKQDLASSAAAILRQYPGTTMQPLDVPESLGPQHQMRLDIQTNPVGAES
jgi:hypothetical protein